MKQLLQEISLHFLICVILLTLQSFLSCLVPQEAVLSSQAAEVVVLFFPQGKRGRGGEGFSTILPVIHANGNDLR